LIAYNALPKLRAVLRPAPKAWLVVKRALDANHGNVHGPSGNEPLQSGRCWLAAENARAPQASSWSECVPLLGQELAPASSPETPSRARSAWKAVVRFVRPPGRGRRRAFGSRSGFVRRAGIGRVENDPSSSANRAVRPPDVRHRDHNAVRAVDQGRGSNGKVVRGCGEP